MAFAGIYWYEKCEVRVVVTQIITIIIIIIIIIIMAMVMIRKEGPTD
jgi:hypothetical protein